ncbi:conserved hypothetical protein [hydrothermal vent metagenome]|uniref:Class I SAM-dependent methyltransferase n=1 Tax=hydrothermal vent metagenome TaxID=652676 RepID=A0A3B1B424_9ZZZZ
MNKFIMRIIPFADILLVPFVYPAAWLLKIIRRAGVQRLPLCKKALLNVGVFPIRNHYYEPQFDFRKINHSFSEKRNLPGINWNIAEQLEILGRFSHADELADIPAHKTDDLRFHFNNIAFESGDAEYWYQIIRLVKPKRIFEIGSGNSTLMAIKAIHKNIDENPSYKCKHVCIEPYAAPWLEKIGITVVRNKVEDIELSFFSELEEDDILFIDSSHIIRPEGDVVFECLQLLPSLNKGVVVHIHDIFSPSNYPDQWLKNDIKFWNEQYLLEAFLSHNDSWKVIGSLNYLHHNYYEALKKACPFLTPDREPGSFYIQKIV